MNNKHFNIKDIANFLIYVEANDEGQLEKKCTVITDAGIAYEVTYEEGINIISRIIEQEIKDFKDGKGSDIEQFDEHIFDDLDTAWDKILELFEEIEYIKVCTSKERKEFLEKEEIEDPKQIEEEDKRKQPEASDDSAGEDAPFEEDETENKPTFFNKLKKALKKIKIRFIAIGLVVVTIATGGLYRCTRESKEGAMKPITVEDNNDKNNQMLDKDYSTESVQTMINDCQNKQKKSAMQTMWTAMSIFNRDFADKHVNGDKKLSHSFAEEMSEYIAYNYLSQVQIGSIYDNTNVSADELKNAYTSAFDCDVDAHAIQTESLGKQNLIDSHVGKDLYTKYENLMIEFNTSSSVEDKQTVATAFFNNIREDLPFITTGSQDEMPNYMNAILPMAKAMDQLAGTLGVNDFSDEEIENIDNAVLNGQREVEFRFTANVTDEHHEEISGPSYENFEAGMNRELGVDLSKRAGTVDWDAIIEVVEVAQPQENTQTYTEEETQPVIVNTSDTETPVLNNTDNTNETTAEEVHSAATAEEEQENNEELAKALEEAEESAKEAEKQAQEEATIIEEEIVEETKTPSTAEKDTTTEENQTEEGTIVVDQDQQLEGVEITDGSEAEVIDPVEETPTENKTDTVEEESTISDEIVEDEEEVEETPKEDTAETPEIVEEDSTNSIINSSDSEELDQMLEDGQESTNENVDQSHLSL